MYLCTYISMYLCIYVSMYLCIHVSMYLCIYVSMYLCIHVYMYLCIHVSYFSFEKSAWTTLPSMLEAAYSPVLVMFGQFLYVMGGIDDQRVKTTVQIYDMKCGMWESVSRHITCHKYRHIS